MPKDGVGRIRRLSLVPNVWGSLQLIRIADGKLFHLADGHRVRNVYQL